VSNAAILRTIVQMHGMCLPTASFDLGWGFIAGNELRG
jgi:hypothetical protein